MRYRSDAYRKMHMNQECRVCFNSDDLDAGDQTCSADQFTCQEGQCVPAKYRCDRVKDCVDNSDENNCSEIPHAYITITQIKIWDSPGDACCQVAMGTFTFQKEFEIIFFFPFADYPPCTEKACANGACYNNSQHCNGLQDCRDGSDEFNCSEWSRQYRFN